MCVCVRVFLLRVLAEQSEQGNSWRMTKGCLATLACKASASGQSRCKVGIVVVLAMAVVCRSVQRHCRRFVAAVACNRGKGPRTRQGFRVLLTHTKLAETWLHGMDIEVGCRGSQNQSAKWLFGRCIRLCDSRLQNRKQSQIPKRKLPGAWPVISA